MNKVNDALLGHLSGYPKCCILTFRIRSLLFRFSLTREWMLKRPGGRIFKRERGEERHVMCLGHLLAKYLGLYKIKYQDCPICGWQELNGIPGKCSISYFHVTKRHRTKLFNEKLRVKKSVQRSSDE